jgi:exopolyphosphatase/guanosine-5'-triphosphate,3'-diphosphate pyrophosphatase
VNRLRVHDQGIRAGLIYEIMDEFMPQHSSSPRPAEDRMRAVRTFLAACNQEPRHADHVAALARQIFDGLAAELSDRAASWATNNNRDLLHAASLLHDVGYLINYTQHHKHSEHLIRHSGLAGFTRRELEIIAGVARYHRGAKPKIKHGAFARLAPEDRDIVRRLAAILRIAVGLDRSHAQVVGAVDVTCVDGVAVMEVRAPREPGVELWGARRKSKLFGDAFGVKLSLHWSPEIGGIADVSDSSRNAGTIADPTPL